VDHLLLVSLPYQVFLQFAAAGEARLSFQRFPFPGGQFAEGFEIIVLFNGRQPLFDTIIAGEPDGKTLLVEVIFSDQGGGREFTDKMRAGRRLVTGN
jgi:hypothetical protein